MDFLTTIRIYNEPSDNRTFVRHMVHDFEMYDGIDELKETVYGLCKKFFADHVSLQDVDIGFVGQNNKKMYIKTDEEVEDAYDSRVFHKHNELVLFIEQRKRNRRLSKRKSTNTFNGM